MKNVKYLIIESLIIVCHILIISMGSARASVIKASGFGYDPVDATNAFQQALNSSYDTIVFDLQSKSWNVAPNSFSDLNNKVLIFEKDVVLKALPKAYPKESDWLQ
jgi:hypothetical protein